MRSALEFAVPIWTGALTQKNIDDIERVQKTAFKVILSSKYVSYSESLKVLNETTLEQRRKHLCRKFAVKCTKNIKMSSLFKRSTNKPRNGSLPKYLEPLTKSKRASNGCIPFLTRLLNDK